MKLVCVVIIPLLVSVGFCKADVLPSDIFANIIQNITDENLIITVDINSPQKQPHQNYSCISCIGTSVSDVTSSCWEETNLEDTRFVSLVSCSGSCMITTINHTTIGLVQYKRGCDPSCNDECIDDRGNVVCNYCCTGNRCNNLIPSYKKTTFDNTGSVSIRNLKTWLNGVFSKPRHHSADPSNKIAARKFIRESLKKFGIETEEMKFEVSQRSDEKQNSFLFYSFVRTKIRGVNIMAILPGKHYFTSRDRIIIITSNYDTHKSSSGVNDNGSGVVSLLELARLFSSHKKQGCKREFTIILVAVDFKQEGHYSEDSECFTRHFEGSVGNAYFICDWLIPHIRMSNAKVLFAISLDTLLNRNTRQKSQRIPKGKMFKTANVRKLRQKISRNSYTGDFTLAFDTSNDSESERFINRMSSLINSNKQTNSFIYQRFIDGEKLVRHLPTQCLPYRVIQDPFPCISLTDTGKYRGYMESCHHSNCDDGNHVTSSNLSFLAELIDSVWKSVEGVDPGGCHPTEDTYTRSVPIVKNQRNICRQPLLNNKCIGQEEKDECELPQIDYTCSLKKKSQNQSCASTYVSLQGNQIDLSPFTNKINLRLSFGTDVYLHSMEINSPKRFRLTSRYGVNRSGPRVRGQGVVRRRFNKQSRDREESVVTDMVIRVKFSRKISSLQPWQFIIQFYGCAFP